MRIDLFEVTVVVAVGLVVGWALKGLIYTTFIEPARWRRMERAAWRRHQERQRTESLGLPTLDRRPKRGGRR